MLILISGGSAKRQRCLYMCLFFGAYYVVFFEKICFALLYRTEDFRVVTLPFVVPVQFRWRAKIYYR